ncbi:hypothetical protein BA184_00885 [Helicobacter pullorum]|uniref:hypothetical protein n=1 Tax=Helicobacter pullorum TaxID=35818 RepID=UPI000816971F|nr:hypothetical protein [Helicobacter pullorum]OCR03721.1 hypothetical protein BA729_05965 [Helicobacter pullorum]OCR07087.1 hypothetical protein BA185_05745 [Helicobacter pullorum]OCR11744.1 hypothetical protein BA184_00885 [Helicobacter pullorum]OCR11841.1 hypothetical protein BA730_07155 [Helicobacter pullorum]OCR19092.1 hypothetical protein BA918_04535 [Helicobacter pullorum]
MNNVITIIHPNKKLKETDIEKFQGQIKNYTPEELKNLAKEQAKQISIKIQEVSEKIVKAKRLSLDAKNVKNSIWETLNPFAESEKDKKIDLLSEANMANSKAIGLQNDLIQGTIKLICCDMVFAELMMEEMALMVAELDKMHGNSISALSDDASKTSKELTKTILHQVAQRVKEMQEIKQGAQETKEEIQEIRENIKSIEENKEEIKENIEEIEEDIEEIEERLRKKKQVDEEQHKLIEKHYQEFTNFKFQIQNDMKEKESKISDLEFKINKKNTTLSIVLSSLALIVGAVAIILHFVK